MLFSFALFSLVRTSRGLFEAFGFAGRPAFIAYTLFSIISAPLSEASPARFAAPNDFWQGPGAMRCCRCLQPAACRESPLVSCVAGLSHPILSVVIADRGRWHACVRAGPGPAGQHPEPAL